MIGKKLMLTSVQMPTFLADLKHANQLLKVFALLAFGIALVESCLVVHLLSRSVQVVVVDSAANRMGLLNKPDPRVEVEAALREYVKLRYSWNSKSVSAQLKSASAFILPSVQSQYSSGVSKVQRFAEDRQVTQNAYIDNIDVDLKAGVAKILGNRVTSIQGLRAAGELKISLFFESGSRTIQNPWGVYVRQEKEESVQ